MNESRPLRIFVEAHMFDHGFEGSASFIQGVYGALLNAYPGCYKVIVGGTRPQRAAAAIDHHDVELALYGHGNRFLRLLVDIPKLIRSSRADIAHFQYFTPLVKTCPWLVTIHDVLFNDFPEYFPPNYRRMRNVLFPLSARRADILTTVSGYSRERIAHWYRVPSERIHLLPNGVAPTIGPDIAGQTIAGLSPYFLCVSRFEPRKNQEVLLNAFLRGRLWEQGFKLVFVGAKTLAAPAFDSALAVAPQGARDAIRLMANLEPKELSALYKNAVAAVYPSRAEGFGIPPLEAIMAGTPSLCGNVTAMSDFDFMQPFFFDLNDSSSLLTALQAIIDEPEAARTKARAAAEHVHNRYTWEMAAHKLHQMLEIHRIQARN